MLIRGRARCSGPSGCLEVLLPGRTWGVSGYGGQLMGFVGGCPGAGDTEPSIFGLLSWEGGW